MTESETTVEGLVREEAIQDAFTRALTNFKGTFHFEKSIKDYGSGETHGLHVQFDYAPDATMEEFLVAARTAAFRAKSFIYEQTGTEAQIVGTGTEAIIMEVVQDAFPGSTVVNEDKPEADVRVAAPPHADAEFKGLEFVDPKFKAMQAANRDWAKERFATHPGEFKDQRAAKASGDVNARAPDYVHKVFKRASFWTD